MCQLPHTRHPMGTGAEDLLCWQSPLLAPLGEPGTTQPVWLLRPMPLGCAERPHQRASPVLSEPPSPSTTPIVLWSACIPGTLSPFEAGVSASAHSGQRGKPSRVVTSPTPQPPAQPNPPAFIPTKSEVLLCGSTSPKRPVQGHAQAP